MLCLISSRFNETETQAVFCFDHIFIFLVTVSFFAQCVHSQIPFLPGLCFTEKRNFSLVQSSSSGTIIFLLPLPEHLCPYSDILYPTSPSLFICGCIHEPRFSICCQKEYRFVVCNISDKSSQRMYSSNAEELSLPGQDTINLRPAVGKHCNLQSTPCLCPCSMGDAPAPALVLAIQENKVIL